MVLPIIAACVVMSAAPLPTDAPAAALALKPLLNGARSVNGTVDIRGIVDLADAGKTAEEQARSYFNTLLGSSVELTVVGVDHTSRGTVVHFKQTVGGNIVEGTHAIAVINRAVLHYASMRLIQAPKAAAPSVNAASAADIAGPQAKANNLAQAPVLAVASNGHGAPTLVWRVPVRNAATAWNAYVDARTGALLSKPAGNGVELVTK